MYTVCERNIVPRRSVFLKKVPEQGACDKIIVVTYNIADGVSSPTE